MKRKILFIGLVFLLVTLVSGAIPYDDWDFVDSYALDNATQITADNFSVVEGGKYYVRGIGSDSYIYYNATNGTTWMVVNGVLQQNWGSSTNIFQAATFLGGASGEGSGLFNLTFNTTDFNDTIVLYIDSQDIIFNDSMKVYVDIQDLFFNFSMTNYVNAQNQIFKDNTSWNQSLADTLYANINSITDNTSWNQSLADTLYADISTVTDNESWNQSHANTLYADISVVDTNCSVSNSCGTILYTNNQSDINITESQIDNLNHTIDTDTWNSTDDFSDSFTNQTYVDSQDIIFNDSMKVYVDIQDLFFNASMKVYVDAQILNNNNTIVTYIYAQDVLFNITMTTYVDGKVSASNDSLVTYIDLQNILFNNSMTTYVDGQDVVFNNSMVIYVDTKILENNNTLVTYINAQILTNNNSVIAYLDSQDILFNDSMKVYVDAQNLLQNNTLVTYIDDQDVLFNDSMKVYVDSTNPWNISGTNIFQEDLSWDVGIGTTTPTQDLTVVGDSNITGNTYFGDCSFNNDVNSSSGNACVGRILEVNKGILAKPFVFGYNFIAQNSNSEIIHLDITGDATFNGTTHSICDDVKKPFNVSFVNQYLTVINSSGVNYAGGTGEIKQLINDSCVTVDIAAAGSTQTFDATAFKYFVYTHPSFSILDNGIVDVSVGVSDLAEFEIKILNGTGLNGVHIVDVAGSNQHQTLSIDMDIKGFDGVVGQNIKMETSKPLINSLSTMFLLENDVTNMDNSETVFIDMKILGTPEDSITNGIKMDSDINHILEVGSGDSITAGWKENITTLTNVTTEIISTDSNVTLFEDDEDYFIVGADVNFTTISFTLDTFSSHNLGFLYSYCNHTHGWEPLSGVTDTTNGLKLSGTISFINPSNRGTCGLSPLGSSLGSSNYSYIAIQRTTNFVVVNPIEKIIGINGASQHFVLQKDMMRMVPTDNPEICTASIEGAIYYDLTDKLIYVCTGADWVWVAT